MSVPAPLPEAQPPPRSEAPDRMADARIVLTKSGQVKDLTRSVRTLLKGAPDDYIGCSVYDVLPSPLDSRLHAALREAVSEEEPITFEAYHPEAKDWLAVRVDPPSDGIEVLVHDITPRKQAERWLHVLESTVLEGLWEVDANDAIVSVNGAFARLLGYESPRDLEGRAATDLFAESAVWPRLRETVAAEGEVEEMVCTYLRSDGRAVRGRRREGDSRRHPGRSRRGDRAGHHHSHGSP